MTYFYEGLPSEASAVAQVFLYFGISHAEKEKADWKLFLSPDGHLRLSGPGGFTGEAEVSSRGESVHVLMEMLGGETGKSPGPWGELLGMRPTKALWRFLTDEDWETKSRAYLRGKKVSADVENLLIDTISRQVKVARSETAESVSFYTHVPFCPTQCSYCSFPSAVAREGEALASYTDALCEDIRDAEILLREAGLHVTSLYMGGGTPTILTAEQLRRVLSTVRRAVSDAPEKEWTVEAGRPDTMTEKKLAVLAEAGVNRISVNPQTMQDRILRKISRAHTCADISEAVKTVRKFGFRTVNMDFICGLPGQKLSDMAENLDVICQYGPENVTIHTLAIKRGSPFFGAEVNRDLPQSDEVSEMLALSRERLAEAGYHPYYLYRQKYMTEDFANVGYALSGHDSLYNIQVIGEHEHVLGTGAGSVTKRVKNTYRLEKLYMPKNPSVYENRLKDLCIKRKKLFL